MKKTLFFVACIAFVLTSCSDKTDADAFSSDVKDVLNVLNGTWLYELTSNGTVYDTETFIFTPYEKGVKKYASSSEDISYTFHGVCKFIYTSNSISDSEFEYYFYVLPSTESIVAYGVHTEKEECFVLTNMKKYDYSIVNNNTIKIHDSSRSYTHTYNRQ